LPIYAGVAAGQGRRHYSPGRQPGDGVQLHQVAFRPAAVEPGVVKVVPEPVRVDPHACLIAAPLDHLVDPEGR
jgi:hypothetical protein